MKFNWDTGVPEREREKGLKSAFSGHKAHN